MSSFLVSKDDVKNFGNVPTLRKQQGVYFVYAAPPEVLEKLAPPPLQIVAPVVIGYIVQFGGTSFGGPYMESFIGTPCKYKDDTGGYAYNLMLYGHGAEGGAIIGTNFCGIPKKIADSMEINRVGDQVSAKVVRHGTTLIDCSIKLGRYNAAAAETFLGNPQPGSINPSNSFFHTFNTRHTENGNCVFTDASLVKLEYCSKSVSWEPGELTIKMNSSPDDPFGELAVLQPIGGAFFENEYIEMTRTVELEKLIAEDVMPYLMTGRYDRSMMGHPSTYLTGYKHN